LTLSRILLILIVIISRLSVQLYCNDFELSFRQAPRLKVKQAPTSLRPEQALSSTPEVLRRLRGRS
jgi:hypothetical protein